MGVSQNEAAGTGSLSQGSVSRVCFVVCFGGLFRTVLLPRTVKFKGSVSGSVSKVCFGVCFGGLFRQSRTSQPYLKLHSPKKCKPICINCNKYKSDNLYIWYPTLMAYRGCGLDFLVTKCVFWGAGLQKSRNLPPKKKKNLTKSQENPLPNPLVLVHQCHTSSLENPFVNLSCQKDTFL